MQDLTPKNADPQKPPKNMNKKALIEEVRKIILRHARPRRIYLYGSQATGEAGPASDIDIAFDDPEFSEISLIEEDLAKLPTLIHIDVKNLAFTEDRFRNRVTATGKVLYSADKKLRFEDSLHNFRNAFERFHKTVSEQNRFEQDGYGDVYLDILVKRFEFTYEMAWKAIRRYLDYLGIAVGSPREAFKAAYAQGLIPSEQIWLDMIEQRDLCSHIYNEEEIREILDKVVSYRNAFEALTQVLGSGLEN
jgi:nucleotidyltransferase substrate binding protein (TIGR01987 family)